jgi:hypothetical protein
MGEHFPQLTRSLQKQEVAGRKARGVVFEECDVPGIKTVNSIASGEVCDNA